MRVVTLKHHMRLSDGIHYRGDVVDRKLIPDRYLNEDYIVEGRQKVAKTIPVDQVELEEAGVSEDIYSPMKELDLGTPEKPKRLIRRR